MKRLRARCKIWFEIDGVSVLGEGRVTLLRAIDECGSLSTAAKKIGMSYRHAYQLVSALNERCGRKVIQSSIGGTDGGGMILTDYGKQLLERYESTREKLDRMLAKKFDG